jgi:hypothetical protein
MEGVAKEQLREKYVEIIERAYRSLFFQKSGADLSKARKNPRTAIIEQLHLQIQAGDYTELEACIKPPYAKAQGFYGGMNATEAY